MTTKKKPIRNERFRFLLENTFEGNQAEMANALGIASSLVWRYAYDNKGIGEDMKKHIHLKLKLNDDWLDGVDDPVKNSQEDDEEFSKIFGLKKEEVGFDLIELIRLYAKSGKESRLKAKEVLSGRDIERSKKHAEGTNGSDDK